MMPPFVLALLDLPPEGSTASYGIDALHVFVITTTMISSTLVFAMAIYFVVRYRRRSESELTPRLSATVWSEGGIITGILSLFILWWVIGFRQFVAMHDAAGRRRDRLRHREAVDVEVRLPGRAQSPTTSSRSRRAAP